MSGKGQSRTKMRPKRLRQLERLRRDYEDKREFFENMPMMREPKNGHNFSSPAAAPEPCAAPAPDIAPPKRRRYWPWILLGALIAILAGAGITAALLFGEW